MARQTVIWTVLPNGREARPGARDRLRVSIVVSPRLTPEAPDEQRLAAFKDWLKWPGLLAQTRFGLQIGNQELRLEPASKPDPGLWRELFNEDTPVAGFVYRDMSRVNLRSYSVRNVLRLARHHYARIATESVGEHPRLLPWSQADGNLRDMLEALGTRTAKYNLGGRSIEVLGEGFERFHDNTAGADKDSFENRVREMVFNPKSNYTAQVTDIGAGGSDQPQAHRSFPIRVLPADWQGAQSTDKDLMQLWRSAEEYTLYQADRFYRRQPPTAVQLAMRHPNPAAVPPPPAPELPEIDFHRMLAAYADYPALLRRLGLVIDALLPEDSPIDKWLAQNPSMQGQMRLIVKGPGRDPAIDACPRSAWEADRERFTMRPRTKQHERGLLRLRDADDRWQAEPNPYFSVYQCDPDGTALKTTHFLLSAQRLLGRSLRPDRADGAVTYNTGDRQPLAALRSNGLGISQHGRAGDVAQDAAAATLKNQAIEASPAQAGQITLFAEDVLRGYRVDVQSRADEPDAPWHSLCRRVGDYRLSASQRAIDLPPDEGYVKGASTTSGAGPGSDPDDHYLHESLFRWTGWSLVAPLPGRTLRERIDPASGVQGEQIEDVDDEVIDGGAGVTARFRAEPGSLPRLRYGVQYRLRARLVDLAGNSLDARDPSLREEANVTRPVGYWRFEPVDPPALVQRARTSEGESIERLVIRSNADVDAKAYLLTPDFAAASALDESMDFEYGPVSERHLVPPKASQQLCETHGMFDTLWSNPSDIRQAYAIAARDVGTLFDRLPDAQVEVITPNALQGIATFNDADGTPRLPTADNPTGDRLAPGQYVIHREAQVETPYLTDPAAGGVALRAMPGHALPGVTGPMDLGEGASVVISPLDEPVLLVSHGKSWPAAQGFRLVLAEQPAKLQTLPCEEILEPSPPHWDADARVLTLFVPKGRIVRLRYASFVDKALLDSFGLPRWVQDPMARGRLLMAANLGCAWTLTPWRELTLVHATQQPVCEPELLKLNVSRMPDDQHAVLQAQVRLHGPSTGKFEIEASWRETIDDPERPGPEVVESRGVLPEIQLRENHANVFELPSAVIANNADPARPRAPGNRHEFGDTRLRLIHYRVRASTRFREYLPPALHAQADKITRRGPVAEGRALQRGADEDFGAPVLDLPDAGLYTVVPASAPPDAPRVLYTLPTFRWQRSTTADSQSVTRIGNGLRVWLDRPWFSSGDGELLGVILLPSGGRFAGMDDRLTPYVTQWGMDPFWDTARPSAGIEVRDFPARVADEAVSLLEVSGQTVHVVGHRVRWHAERRLWYCDIELDPGRGYMPFVRLALVRYQPHALAGARISKVVMAEFAQVLPRRQLQLTASASGISLALRGVVPTHGPTRWTPDEPQYAEDRVPGSQGRQETGRNRVQLVLQLRDPEIDSDLGWSDASVLASGVLQAVPSLPVVLPTPTAAPSGEAPTPVIDPGPVRVEDRLGRVVDLERVVELGGRIADVQAAALGPGSLVGELAAIDPKRPFLPSLLDPLVWQTPVYLPALRGRIARLVVREFERYYTGEIEVEHIGKQAYRRHSVEQRLVFTAFLDLPQPPVGGKDPA